MRLNLFTLTSLALLSNIALADVEPDEIPNQCQQVCHPVVQRSQHCDSSTQDDHAEKECLCKLDNAKFVVPQCEACVAKYHSEVSDHSNPHDNDVYDIIQFCGFSTTTYTGNGAASATPTSSMGMSSMSSATSTGANPTGTGSSGSGSSSGAGGMTSPSASQSGSMPSASASASSSGPGSSSGSGSGSGSGAGSGSGSGSSTGSNSMGSSSASGSSSSSTPTVTNAATVLEPMIPAVGLLGLLTVAWM